MCRKKWVAKIWEIYHGLNISYVIYFADCTYVDVIVILFVQVQTLYNGWWRTWPLRIQVRVKGVQFDVNSGFTKSILQVSKCFNGYFIPWVGWSWPDPRGGGGRAQLLSDYSPQRGHWLMDVHLSQNTSGLKATAASNTKTVPWWQTKQ